MIQGRPAAYELFRKHPAQADNGGRHVDERQVDCGQPLVADQDPSEALQPGERALHVPALSISSQFRLSAPAGTLAPTVRDAGANATAAPSLAKGPAVG